MKVRGIRGGTTVQENAKANILYETEALLKEVVHRNDIDPDDVACVFITVSPDLTATFPARAIRNVPGWQFVPLMGGQAMAVPVGLKRCIRLMILMNTEKASCELNHVYLNEAVVRRPDLVG